MDATKKVGVITGTGDRRDEDIISIGSITAKYFDEIIIRKDKHLRGRTEEEIFGLLQQGINESKPGIKVTIIPDEKEAFLYALKNAEKGSLITLLADKVDASIEMIKKQKEEEENL